MENIIHEPVSVITSFNHETRRVFPRKLRWRNREYQITKVAYHHTVRQGRLLYHIFHVTDGTIDFRLIFNTETLHWILEDIVSGN